MTEPRSSLAPLAAGMRDPDDARARQLAREAYHDDDIVLINLRWCRNWPERKQLTLIADRIHGPRPAQRGKE